MKPGDCVNIPAEVKHWHGAAPDEWFSHLAIEVPGEKTSSEWCEIVTDEIYGKSVYLKRRKLLRELLAVYKINSVGDFDLMI